MDTLAWISLLFERDSHDDSGILRAKIEYIKIRKLKVVDKVDWK